MFYCNSDPEVCAEADMIYELTQDMNDINPIRNFYAKDSDAYNAAYQKYFAALPARLTACAKLLGDKPFFGGDAPHFGDLALFSICFNTSVVNAESLTAFPTIVAWMKRCEALPGVAKYLASRPRAPDVGVPGSFINPTSK